MKLGVLMHTCNPSTQEMEAGGLQVWGQPGLHSETLPQKHNEKLYICKAEL
jgi:hypothetical protein